MASDSLSRRYAAALLDVAAERDEVATAATDLAAFYDVLEAVPALREVFANPLVDPDDSDQVVLAVSKQLGTSKTVTNLLRLLAQRRRMNLIDGMIEAFQELADAKAGVVRAHITSATALSDKQVEQISTVIGQARKVNVKVSAEVDSALLGGVVTRIGDEIFDGSLITQLKQLRARLHEG